MPGGEAKAGKGGQACLASRGRGCLCLSVRHLGMSLTEPIPWGLCCCAHTCKSAHPRCFPSWSLPTACPIQLGLKRHHVFHPERPNQRENPVQNRTSTRIQCRSEKEHGLPHARCHTCPQVLHRRCRVALGLLRDRTGSPMDRRTFTTGDLGAAVRHVPAPTLLSPHTPDSEKSRELAASERRPALLILRLLCLRSTCRHHC